MTRPFFLCPRASALAQVKQLILLDPVCVLLALPDVMYNFLYRMPRSLTEHIIYYGGSMVGTQALTDTIIPH